MEAECVARLPAGGRTRAESKEDADASPSAGVSKGGALEKLAEVGCARVRGAMGAEAAGLRGCF